MKNKIMYAVVDKVSEEEYGIYRRLASARWLVAQYKDGTVEIVHYELVETERSQWKEC